MLVREVMSAGVVTARRSESVRSVVTKMLSRHCGAIPVVEDDNLLIGMVASFRKLTSSERLAMEHETQQLPACPHVGRLPDFPMSSTLILTE